MELSRANRSVDKALLTVFARQHPFIERRKRAKKTSISVPDDQLLSAFGEREHSCRITSFTFNSTVFSLIISAGCRETEDETCCLLVTSEHESSDANETQQSEQHGTQCKEKDWNL
jgi:hypothetical protein